MSPTPESEYTVHSDDPVGPHEIEELREFIDGLNYRILFGADAHLTTVDRTLVSINVIRTCYPSNHWHEIECELMFDPMAGTGQLMGYIHGERTIWHDISWADFVR